VTPKAGEKVAKDQLTQVGRALGQLGIEHIPAYSPEARGRSERAFGTGPPAEGVGARRHHHAVVVADHALLLHAQDVAMDAGAVGDEGGLGVLGRDGERALCSGR
jgi:hypothetical protein